MYINIITFYVVSLPSAFYLCFRYSSTKQIQFDFDSLDTNEIIIEVPGLGIKGIWLAFFLGFIHQMTAYLIVIHKMSDWEKIKDEAILR